MRTIIAIDPGMNGGIAKDINYDMGESIVRTFSIVSMPVTIKDIITEVYIQPPSNCDVTVYLEDVHTMPGQGIASSGKFMRGVGNLEAIAMCLGYKLIYVRPQVWQKHFSLLTKKGESKTAHKNRIKAFAQQRYPNIKVTLATADALAILEYAKDKEKE